MNLKTGKKIFWGILFLLGALALLIGKMGYLDGFGFWSIFISVCMVGLLIEGICERNFGTILFSLAFLAIVNDELLGIEAITPWPVLGAALLGTIGLSILFPNHDNWKKHIPHVGVTSGNTQECLDGENIHFETTFNESVKYVTSSELVMADLECSFGSLSVYFNNCQLKNGTATVHVENSFGGMVLYIPSDWKVNINVNCAFGGAEEKGYSNPNGTNILQIVGDVSFGGLEIRYI